MLLGAGYLDTSMNSVLNNFGPKLGSLLGAVLLVYGIVKIVQGIMTQQQRTSHLTWGAISFIIGAVFLSTGVVTWVQGQGKGTATDIGLLQ